MINENKFKSQPSVIGLQDRTYSNLKSPDSLIKDISVITKELVISAESAFAF